MISFSSFSAFFPKKYFFPLFFLFLPFSAFTAEESPQDQAACQTAWTGALDQADTFFITNPDNGLAVFLLQDEVHPADLWSAYRGFSLRSSCAAAMVCNVVEYGFEHLSETTLSVKNKHGGSIPSPFAACSDETYKKFFETLEVDTAAFDSCGDPTWSVQCREYVKVSNVLFDTMLKNMIWKDVGRRVIGIFVGRITKLTTKISELREDASRFARNFGKSFNRLCSLSQVDEK